MRHRLIGVFLFAVVVGVAILTTADTAGAIPAFARKYRTSCQTCHVSFPYLTPFGEAFRRNGFSFPEGLDEDYIKSPPVMLGASAYRDVWPDAVYPADIPGLPPISLVIESEFGWSSEDHATSFSGAGGAVELLAGGTVGDRISFYGEIGVHGGGGHGSEIEIERAYAVFKFDTESPVANLRVGRFEPQVLNTSNHRRLGGPKYLALMPMGGVGFNGWGLEPTQQGVELSGVLFERSFYTLGLVEGSGNLSSSSKDGYIRLGHKWGGMRPDGVVEDMDSSIASPRPWAERSASLSAYWYGGSASLEEGHPKDRFDVLGADVRVIFDDIIFDIGADRRSHSGPYAGGGSGATGGEESHLETGDHDDDHGEEPGHEEDAPSPFGGRDEHDSGSGTNFWMDASYVLYPWLIPSARYERFNQSGVDALNRFSATLNMLIRANVKAKLSFIRSGSQGDKDAASEVELSFEIAF